jgi:hypothetical protein
MNSFNTSLPPHVDPATITLAAALLASLADPAGTQTRLTQLADVTNAMRAAHADALSARAEADQAVAKLAGSQADLASFETEKAEHAKAVLALSVASEAVAERERIQRVKASELEAQQQDLQRRTAAFDSRLKTWRDQLAG